MDKEFVFAAEEDVEESVQSASKKPWKVLIVDDDEAMHRVAQKFLVDFEYDGRTLEFLNAYSGEEGRKVLAEHDDIAVALFDVVMESKHAGLELVDHARQELNRKNMVIILRTGQAGSVPEKETIRKYDLYDFKNKSELTDDVKFYTMMTSALRSYTALLRLENQKKAIQRVNQLNDTVKLHTPSFNLALYNAGILDEFCSIFDVPMEDVSGFLLAFEKRQAMMLPQEAAYLGTETRSKVGLVPAVGVLATAGRYQLEETDEMKEMSTPDGRAALESRHFTIERQVHMDIERAIREEAPVYDSERCIVYYEETTDYDLKFQGMMGAPTNEDRCCYLLYLETTHSLEEDNELIQLFLSNINQIFRSTLGLT